MKTSAEKNQAKVSYSLNLSDEVAKKFEKLLSEDNLIHGGVVAHNSNNINIAEVPDHSNEG